MTERRVLAAVPDYPPASMIGSWLSTHELLVGLVRQGFDVSVVRTGAPAVLAHPDAAWTFDGVRVLGTGSEVFARALRTGTPGVLVTHAGDNRSWSQTARAYCWPNVRMVHGRVRGPRASLGGADALVFNSHQLAESTPDPPPIRGRRHRPAPRYVVHPPLDPARYTPDDAPDAERREFITCVNMSEAKGGDRFVRLAKARPDLKFLGVLGGYGRQVLDFDTPNLRYHRTTPDIAQVYAQTRILCAPSTAETWGRTPLEAAVSGIPSIVSATSGAVEAMGDGAVMVPLEAGDDVWLGAIDTLVNSSRAYAGAQARARARLAEFLSGPDPVQAFADIVSETGARFAAAL